MSDFPFKEETILGKRIRKFAADVDAEELQWHQDLNDRKVTVIKSDGWKFQMGDALPKMMCDGDEIFIPALKWHRAIKGFGELVIEIEEKPA